jgi:endonuclease/exonuclease/phosphatase family metal-dependent hydrolase
MSLLRSKPLLTSPQRDDFQTDDGKVPLKGGFRGAVVFFFFFLLALFAMASEKTENYKIMFYNVENLFDNERDSTVLDKDFTQEGNYHWTYNKYKKKISDIAKTIAAVGEWEAPILVGLCEIENERVLWDLIKNKSPLENESYSFIHKNSPDLRGIDVALLYRKDKFKPLHKEFIAIEGMKTRDILYASGIITTGDTLHVFVNHWSSRLGGQMESEPKRVKTASLLKSKIDSINGTTDNPRIIIMGDFNDTPLDKSIKDVLGAKPIADSIENRELYNLMYPFEESGEIGTHKYGAEWSVLDQIIISGTLLNEKNNFYTTKEKSVIFAADFLKEDDEKNQGFRPHRTFRGMKYEGGVSDHFPVYVEFQILITPN